MSGWSVGKIIIIILKSGLAHLKIKVLIIDLNKFLLLCQLKLHPHLFTRDSTMSSALNFSFLCILL